MAVTNRPSDEEVQRLMETLKAKEIQVTQYEKEVKKISKARDEMFKIIQERDNDLATILMEKMPEIERLVTEECRKERPVSAIKHGGRAFLQMKEDSKTNMENFNSHGGNLIKGAIALALEQNITGILDEKVFSAFQKEIFSYYANLEEKFNMEDLVRENPFKEIESSPEDLIKVNWQYCIVFPNPDSPRKQVKWEGHDADRIYDRCFWPDKRLKNSTSKTQENLIFRHILNKYCKLEDKRNGEKLYAFNKGGNLVQQEEKSGHNKEFNNPKDILTLLRNITIFKLTRVLHLQTASILSEDGQKIYVLVHADENLLRDHADWIEYELQFEIGSTDILSLEPCDDKLRPYRLIHEDKPHEIVQLENELKYFSDLIYQNELEVYNGQNIADSHKHYDLEWEAYKYFLEFLIQKKTETEKLILQYPELKGLFIRELYQKAFLHVNQERFFKLKNLWNYFGVPPVGAFKKYYREFDKILEQDKADGFWRRYVNNEGHISLFKDLDKIKLIISYIFSQLRLDKMLQYEVVENYFPLHSKDFYDIKGYSPKIETIVPEPPLKSQEDIELNQMRSEEEGVKSPKPEGDYILTSKLLEKHYSYTHVKTKWSYSWIGKVPSNSIRNYFGEKVAFYYEFLSFYTLYLFILGILGIIVYIIQNTDSLESKSVEFFHDLGFKKSRLVIAINTIYSFMVIIWSSVFLEHWKRREANLATEWGQKQTQAVDQMLPSYKGKKRRSPINDNLNETSSSHVMHMLKKVLAYAISVIIVAIVILIVVYLLYFRNWLVINKIGGAGNRIIVNVPTILNIIQITLFNLIYNKVAYYMNDVENHKSYESYESSLATKIFLFQFVNSFNSLVIIAFLKTSIDFMGGCVKTLQFAKNVSKYNYCDEELENQMITIGIINFVKNFSEIGVPWLLNKWKNAQKRNKHNELQKNDAVSALRSKIEYQNNLEDFDVGFVDGTFDDYLELVIQFGSITLFAMSFSLLPILAFFTNILEIQVDKTKLLYLSKRPNPVSANSIGNWFYIFEILSFLAIFSNVGILVFTYNNYYELDLFGKAVLYMALVFFYIIVKLSVVRFIPDVSSTSKEIQSRHQFIVDKNCDGVAQEPVPTNHYKVNLNVISF